MSVDQITAEEAFRRVGERQLLCLQCPAFTEHVEWVNFENAEMLNNELGRLEGKKWWRRWEDTASYLWHVNEMRREAGLPPLVMRANAGWGFRFEETAEGGETGEEASHAG